MSFLNTLIARNRSENGSANETPTVAPAYRVRETPEAYGLTVYLPGVGKDGLEITAEEGQLRITGRRAWTQPEKWTALYRESDEAPFQLLLEHDNAVDLDKIEAELRDGVLRVSLPKQEALKPRKIAIG